MKNKDLQKKKLKSQLYSLHEKKVSQVVLELTEEMNAYVKSFCPTEPFIHRVRTKIFSKEICKKNQILRDLTYSKKSGKDTVFIHLKKSERKILDKYGVNYKAVKYTVFIKYINCLNKGEE